MRHKINKFIIGIGFSKTEIKWMFPPLAFSFAAILVILIALIVTHPTVIIWVAAIIFIWMLTGNLLVRFIYAKEDE